MKTYEEWIGLHKIENTRDTVYNMVKEYSEKAFKTNNPSLLMTTNKLIEDTGLGKSTLNDVLLQLIKDKLVVRTKIKKHMKGWHFVVTHLKG